VGAISEAAEAAVQDVLTQLAASRIEQEPDFTSQFVAGMRGEFRRSGFEQYNWDVKVLTDRGRGAQERTYGADLLVVQHFDSPDYRVTKGFLAQAKLGARRPAPRGIVEQCDRMLDVTPEAFVFRYDRTGIMVTSAAAAVASDGELDQLRWKPFSEFLLDFMTSFVGDRRLRAATVQELERLVAEHRARMGLHIRVDHTRVDSD
jgi:hypothetical protein